jgi:hypothetical protein
VSLAPGSSAAKARSALTRDIELPRLDPLLAGAIAAAVLARIAFWAYTGARWEDSLITLTHVRNAVDGLGLVHHLGEGRVQGFTSALSVLIPLPAEAIHSGWGLTALRLASLVAAAATVAYAWGIGRMLGIARLPMAFVLAYLAFDGNQILFAVGGMETQLAVAILLGGIYHLMREQTLRTGLFLGLGLLARPDFILWVIPAVAYLLYRDRRQALRAIAVLAAVFGPWLVFTTAYYGTPVPHTIIAKSAGYAEMPAMGAGIGAWWDWVGRMIGNDDHLWWHFAPFYEHFANSRVTGAFWFQSMAFVVIALALAGAWVTRARAAWRPAVAFALVYPVYLIFTGDWFMWYSSPFLAVTMIGVAAALTRAGAFVPRTAGVAALVLAVAFSAQTPFVARLERTVQHDIEERVRQPLGEYLGAVVRPGQSVASESAGYFGYYGHVKLYDFPGLTSPASLAAVRKIPLGHRWVVRMIPLLRPDWIVARAYELQQLKLQYPRVMRDYVGMRRFYVSEKSSRLHTLMVDWVTSDRDYYVLRRRDVRPRPFSLFLSGLQ